MPTFSIDDDNNITLVDTAAHTGNAGNPGATTFDSEAALARISAEWSLSRLVDIWNSIPGHPEVHRFAARSKAVARIWKAVQPLARNGQPADVNTVSRNNEARSPNRKSPSAHKLAKKTAAKSSGRNNKKAAVIAMMNRARGATLPEIMKATAWQAHTVRGFISILGSKGGHSIESTKNAAGARTYCIVR